jgi:hypothetical protein
MDGKIIERIRKLLAMSKDSSSPNEAMIATKRARHLMDKYQITHDDIKEKSGDDCYGSVIRNKGSKRVVLWKSCILNAVSKLNDCVGLIDYEINGDISFRVSGFKEDAIIAGYMYDFLLKTCDRLYKKSGIKGKANANAYRLGFSLEITKKVHEILSEREKIKVSNTNTSLVLRKKEMVSSHFNVGLCRTHESSSRKMTHEEFSNFNKGVSDAKDISLSQQLAN